MVLVDFLIMGGVGGAGSIYGGSGSIIGGEGVWETTGARLLAVQVSDEK